MQYNALTLDEAAVIEKGATEPAFHGEYDNFFENGTFICRRCNAPLYSSKAKFDAGCGWPAFDATFPDAVIQLPDPDGQRVEIRCAHCDGHLGHIFTGEQYTKANTRHCVNSLSLRFIPHDTPLPQVLG